MQAAQIALEEIYPVPVGLFQVLETDLVKILTNKQAAAALVSLQKLQSKYRCMDRHHRDVSQQ